MLTSLSTGQQWWEVTTEIANPRNSAQLDGTPTIPPSYIRVCAVVVKDRQTDIYTGGHDQYTFCLSYASREM